MANYYHKLVNTYITHVKTKQYINEGTYVAIDTERLITQNFNLLKPTGYGMHQQVEYFNNCTLCPHCIYVFCICLRTNSDFCHLHKKSDWFL
jgi:hypothetical protein